MTDSEKELRRLAEETKTKANWSRFAMAANPAAVLALLDRIEALEKQVAEAERKGAEEMRKQAQDLAKREEDLALAQQQKDSAAKYGRFDYYDGRRAQARTLWKWIGDLVLPGDAP